MRSGEQKKTVRAKDRIAHAAFELFSSRGYQGATTRDIAALACVAEVTIFRHFQSKENLFAEVLRSFSSMPAMAELAPRLHGLPYDKALETMLEKFMERLEQNRGWIQLLQCEMRFAPPAVQQVYVQFLERLFAVFTEYFRGLQKEGVVRADLEPESIARAFHSLSFGFYHVENLLGNQGCLMQERRRMIDDFLRLFHTGTQR